VGESARGWLGALVVAACVGAEVLLAGATDGSVDGWPRPIAMTVIVGLMAVAMTVAVGGTMGLAREAMGVRLIAIVPMLLSVALVVVVLLEFHFRMGADVPALVGARGGG